MRIYALFTERIPIEVEETANVGDLRRLIAQRLDIEDPDDAKLYFEAAPLLDDAAPLRKVTLRRFVAKEPESCLDVVFAVVGRPRGEVEEQETAIGAGAVVTVLCRPLAEEHGRGTYVRSVREAFEDLKASGDADAVTEAAALAKSQQFPLDCTIYDFGELGAGWVLLFEFILFVGVLCVGCFVILLPALWLYFQSDGLQLWPAAEMDNREMASHGYLSIGNVGPKGTASDIPGGCCLACSVAVLLAAAHYSRRQRTVKKQVDANEVDPNDFAIFVHGLPEEERDERRIAEYFEAHARNDEHTEVVTVVLGFDVAAFKELRQQARDAQVREEEAKEALATLRSTSIVGWPLEAAAEYQRWVQEATDELRSARDASLALRRSISSPEALKAQLPTTGQAVVVLRSQEHHRECLEEWNSFWETLASWCPRLFGSKSSKPLYLERHRLSVERAANPSNIVWENLGFSSSARWRARRKTYGMLMLLFLGCLAFVWIVSYFAPEAQSIAIIFSNFTAAMSIRKLVVQERHETKTERDLAVMAKMSLFYASTYTLIPILLHLQPGESWYTKPGLLTTQWSLIFYSGIAVPMVSTFGPANRIRRYFANRVDPAESPGLTQPAYQKMFEPPEMDPARTFAKVFKTLAVGLWFSPMVPLGLLVTVFALTCEYWGYKYQLLRLSKRPYRQGHEICYGALRLLIFLNAILALTSLYFLSPSLKPSTQQLVSSYWPWILLISLLMMLAPTKMNQFLLCTWLCQRVSAKKTSTETDYYAAQTTWPKHQKYQTTNLVYLQFEGIVLQATARGLGAPGGKLPWDPRTGNFLDPSAPSPSTSGLAGSTSPFGSPELEPPPAALSPPAGRLAGAGVAGSVSALDGDSASPAVAGGVDEDDDEAALGEDLPAEETGAIAEADPMALALEEEKFRGIAALVGDPCGDDTEEEDSSGSSDDGGASGSDLESGARRASTPAAIALAVGTVARVEGLTSSAAAAFNGALCTLVSRAEHGGKWLVSFTDGRRAYVPEPCLFVVAHGAVMPGMRVLVDGLEAESAQQYNGSTATAVAWDAERSVWQVRLFNGMQARLPASKIRPLEEG